MPAVATGYAPGLLGDLRWLTKQYQSQYPFAHSLPPIGVAQADPDEAQGSTANDGAIFDSGLWPTGNDLTPTPISAPSQPQRRSPTPNGNQTPPTAPAAQPGPTVSLRPSDGFFSWLFGGPVPIKDSTGATTGYYDHQAANAGLKITGAYAAIAPIFQPGSWAGDLLNEIAPGAAGAISDGIDEAIANHHPWPNYLGGAQDQELVPLRNSLHKAFHSQLGAAMSKDSFPPVGGVTGSTAKWGEYFAKNEGTREKAIAILRQVTADFDRANGTSISPKLEQALSGAGTNPSK